MHITYVSALLHRACPDAFDAFKVLLYINKCEVCLPNIANISTTLSSTLETPSIHLSSSLVVSSLEAIIRTQKLLGFEKSHDR